MQWVIFFNEVSLEGILINHSAYTNLAPKITHININITHFLELIYPFQG